MRDHGLHRGECPRDGAANIRLEGWHVSHRTVTSLLHAYLSTRGVARFATHKWAPVDSSNQGDMLMHLSNSSINQVLMNHDESWCDES